MEIDEECEKAMIQFVYHHRISRMVDFDAVWREFLRIYPLPEIDVSDLKTHYLCMDRGSNKWGLSEDAFLYFKFGSHAEEMDLNAGPEESGAVENNDLPKLIVTFGERKLKFHSGMSWDTLQLCKAALLKKDY